MISLSKESIEEISGNKIERPLSSAGIENVAVLDEVGAQISPSGRLDTLLEQIVPADVRKLAISLMFPLLEKFNMPIKLV